MTPPESPCLTAVAFLVLPYNLLPNSYTYLPQLDVDARSKRGKVRKVQCSSLSTQFLQICGVRILESTSTKALIFLPYVSIVFFIVVLLPLFRHCRGTIVLLWRRFLCLARFHVFPGEDLPSYCQARLLCNSRVGLLFSLLN